MDQNMEPGYGEIIAWKSLHRVGSLIADCLSQHSVWSRKPHEEVYRSTDQEPTTESLMTGAWTNKPKLHSRGLDEISSFRRRSPIDMKNPILLSKEYGVVTRQREPDLSRSGTGTCNFCRQTILHSKTREGVNPNTTRIGGLANQPTLTLTQYQQQQ